MSNLVEIAAIYDPEEACVAQSFLAANGIQAQLANHGMLSLNPQLRIALGGYRVLVYATEKDEAFTLLRDIRKMPNKAGPPCPACGGEDYRRIKGYLFPAIFLLLFGTFVPFARNSGYLECRNCKMRIPRGFTANRKLNDRHQTHT